MKNQFNLNTLFEKEKENILSLFRIPLNYFAEGNSYNSSTSSNNSDASKASTSVDSARSMQKKTVSGTKGSSVPKQANSNLDKVRNTQKKSTDSQKLQPKKNTPQSQNNPLKRISPGNAIKNTDLKKVNPAVNATKNISAALTGDADQKAEAIGEGVKSGAKLALKATGAGAPVAKALDVADKVLGQTEIGKKATKSCGYCATFSCCFAIALFILPFLIIITLFTSAWSWIFGIDATTSNIDRSNLENAITEDMLFDMTRYGDTSIYDILEDRLKDDEFGFMKTVYDENGNVKYDEKGKQVLEKINGVFSGSFSDIYTENHLTPIGQFSTAYEVLISNYTVGRIKEPRHDTGMSALHLPLFENILEDDLRTLKLQFNNSQVPNDFWNDIQKSLNTTYDVYNPITAQTISNISLRDLLIETSSTGGDAKYDIILVEAILNDTQNAELIKSFRRLQESLTRVEVMTYMMTIRDFYAQKAEFLNKMEHDPIYNKKAKNYDFFAANDGAFFDQFLIIPDVETYMALSSTTATPSFAYEIAINSMDTLNKSNAPRHTEGNEVYYFFDTITTWSATYTFQNRIDTSGNYTITCNNIVSTELEENLYTRYDIEEPDDFFNLFESSTGIKISSRDGSTFFLVSDMLPQSNETFFPLAARTSVTHGYMQRYSDATMNRYGITHAEHYGIDFSAKEGTNVLAIKSGTVVDIVESNSGWGNYMIVKHNDGYYSLYAHGNGTFHKTKGSSVSAGEPIMESGNSGNSTGPHLHLQVFSDLGNKSGSTINPVEYINGLITKN